MNDGKPTTVSSSPISIYGGRQSGVVIQNFGPGTIRLGTSQVTSDTGIRLVPGGIATFTEEHARPAWHAVREHDEDATVVAVVVA